MTLVDKKDDRLLLGARLPYVDGIGVKTNSVKKFRHRVSCQAVNSVLNSPQGQKSPLGGRDTPQKKLSCSNLSMPGMARSRVSFVNYDVGHSPTFDEFIVNPSNQVK